ncbi:MAG: IS110 family transposase [Acidobacteriia bacterium]|nr:IS110 family transposase [Terriglobia bacterium]
MAFELVIGTPERFQCAKQIASYLGLVRKCRDTADIVRDGDFSTVTSGFAVVRHHPRSRCDSNH